MGKGRWHIICQIQALYWEVDESVDFVRESAVCLESLHMNHQDGWKTSKGELFGRANFGFTFWTIPVVFIVLIGFPG